jgi:Asp-tRNA(Asn)/Glu-tRNA(Gln) amidotransferase A subunit family amidase
VEPPPPAARLDVLDDFFDLVLTEMLAYHRRFDDVRGDYRYSNRARLEHAERRAMTAEEYVALQAGRGEDTDAWRDWLDEHRVDAVVEPTLPIVAPVRGSGYDEPFGDVDDLSLTHYWDWTGFPVVSLPSGVGRRSGLPVSVSLIGAPAADWDLLAWGAALQGELGTVSP